MNQLHLLSIYLAVADILLMLKLAELACNFTTVSVSPLIMVKESELHGRSVMESHSLHWGIKPNGKLSKPPFLGNPPFYIDFS